MGAKEFDYYVFIDYSENYLGYLIIENGKVREFLPKISKFAHYRELKHKKAYLDSIRKVVDKNKVCSHFCRLKIRKTEATPEIYSDILDFLKKHDNCLVFICVDNKQFINYHKTLMGFVSWVLRFPKNLQVKDYNINVVDFLRIKKLVSIIDGKNIKVIKESELKKHTPEYKISLVLDTLLNLARLKNDKF